MWNCLRYLDITRTRPLWSDFSVFTALTTSKSTLLSPFFSLSPQFGHSRRVISISLKPLILQIEYTFEKKSSVSFEILIKIIMSVFNNYLCFFCKGKLLNENKLVKSFKRQIHPNWVYVPRHLVFDKSCTILWLNRWNVICYVLLQFQRKALYLVVKNATIHTSILVLKKLLSIMA